MLIKRSEFFDTNRLEVNPGGLETELFSVLAKEARTIGEFTFEIIKHSWLNHLLSAESEISTLFRYGARLSDQRLEGACKRTVFYGHTSSQVVKTVLLQRLDSLPLNHKTDIYGQYMLF